MKARTIHHVPQRAENIFTDREEPRRAFWAVYDRVKADPGSVEAISYYGVGGIGKTSLQLQLIREMKDRAEKSPGVYYSFELSGRNKDDCLYFLAESLMQQCSGLQFPLFGAALMRLNQLAGRDISDLEKRMENRLLNRSEVSVAVDVMSAFIPNFSIMKLAGRAGLKLLQTCKKNHEHNRGKYAEVYKEIEEGSAAELMNNLQRYFCMDAAPYLELQSPPVVIFLDGYETLTNSLERGSLAEVEDHWVWDGNGLIWSLPNTLWVIAGRNRLTWDQYDSEIRESLEQHLLGNISETDVEQFLCMSGVREEAIYRTIYQLTEGTPVYLDMCVSTYRQMKAVRGEDYVPVAEDFGSTQTALAERFLRGMNSEHQRVIKLIASLPVSWTDDFAMEAAQKAGYTAARGPFDDIRRLSLVEKDGPYNKLHGAMRAVIRRFMTEEERSRLDTAVFCALIDKMRDPAEDAEREDYASWAVELLDREDCGVDATLEQLRAIFNAASAYNDLGNFRAFYGYVQKVTNYVLGHSVGIEALALCRDNQFKALLNMGYYREAIPFGTDAYELNEQIYGEDHADTLASLNALAIGYSKLGDWQQAMELTNRVYEGRSRTLGEDHDSTVACLNNMAIYAVMQGDYESAAQLMQKAFDAMLRLLGDDHPRTLICANNLASVYSRLGEHERSLELLQVVYQTQLRTLGENHKDILFTLFNLSIGHSKLKEYEKALELAREAYEAHLRILGDEHPDTLAALNNLAECHLNLGDREKAQRLARQALSMRQEILGEDHPDTLESVQLLEKCRTTT